MESKEPEKITRRALLRLGGGLIASNLLDTIARPARVEAGGGDLKDSKERIWKQVTEPSNYAVHALRTVDNMPDINMEQVRLVGLTFWPKDVDPYSGVNVSIGEVLDRTGKFWESALDGKSMISTEVIPIFFTGKKNREEYKSPNDVIGEIEEQLERLEDPGFLKAVRVQLGRAKNLMVRQDSEVYLNPVIFIMGPDNKHVQHSAADSHVTYVNASTDSVLDWEKTHMDNLVAHEVGHGLSFPDQYHTGTESDELWGDPDPSNIMGANMWSLDLSEAHLGQSVKKWVLNQKLPVPAKA